MELYTNTVEDVKFFKPSADANVTAVKYTLDKGDTCVPLNPITQEGGVATVKAPFLQQEGKIRIDWTFHIGMATYTQAQHYDVVTPILHIEEIKEILGTGSTKEEAVRVEKAVRHIINAYTGQTFGLKEETKTVVGRGTASITLPARLVAIKTSTGFVYPDHNWGLSDDGWVITGRRNADDDISVYSFRQSEAVIRGRSLLNPVSYRAGYATRIHGLWGWEYVPDAVREAARLLINDYACGDSMYRDRFIHSMTAADWRIQFNSGAYLDTGNVRANQLLAAYKIPSIGVV